MRVRASGEGVKYFERARMLAPKIEAGADQIEHDRRIPESLIDALVDAGLTRLLLPRSLSGAELDPVTFTQVMEEISKADASTAWVLCQTAGCSMIAAYLRPEVAREVFGRDRRALLAWGPGPAARAVAVEGGYRVTGTWSFASGGRHATWFGGYCPIYEPDGTPRRRDGGALEGRMMLFPASDVRMTDVWHVLGLRGTGSDTYAVSDLFVPEAYSAARDDQSERRHSGALYCFTIGSLFASGFAGVALGIARSMLDAFITLASDKTPRGLSRSLRENAVIQSQVAQAEAALRSARLFLMTSLDEVGREVGRSGQLRLDQRVLIRLAASHAIHQAREVVEIAYLGAGATAIFMSAPFERRFRDMHAVTQQLQGRLIHFETVGQYYLGLEPDLTWL
jgi:alkylation response protein AidB-like acyl-CoA dehydrogenase